MRCHLPSPSRLATTHHHLTHRHFTVLALESSADDTCAAVVTSSGNILSNIVLKQNDVHAPFGGIHPYRAVQAHQRNMPIAVQRALKDARISVLDVDGIAFTRGPGMTGCLGIGSSAAKTLAAALNKPLVGVHHMQAHALTPILTSAPNPPKFPFLTLLISGGHTLLLLAISVTQFRILATTPDESIGRVFDKVSRLLALPWSAKGPGASLEDFVAASPVEDNLAPSMPRTMPGVLTFSFTGLHSAVERFVTARGGVEALDIPTRRAVASGFQRAAFNQLEEKLTLALSWCRDRGLGVKHLVVSGGVASNSYLRERLRAFVLDLECSQDSVSLIFPPAELCTDNAVMIAWASMHRFVARDTDDYAIMIRPKWCVQDLMGG
ncbi:Gcp-like domain-containing protein [Russula earlei]|uniref:Gcp-like domain-containing protein n=1 Tax=Russula earlei TaxID=71964 RepID=A0ACC0UFT1_9AGAM|nr:Gcp-like domain-containing protein [Russula earlei]